jgi:hypothetical protein
VTFRFVRLINKGHLEDAAAFEQAQANQAESRPGVVSHQLEMSFWRFLY